MYAQRPTIRPMGIAVFLAACLALPAWVWAAPPSSNPGQPFAEILAQIEILNDKIDALPDPGATGPCDIAPVWGKKIVGPDRFVPVLDGGAYCDKETGLVWEAAPTIMGGPDNDGRQNWVSAISHCANLEVDDRKGWSLPMREQLATLVDTQSGLCAGGGLCLPDGHPFSDVQSALYWSASTSANIPHAAWLVRFDDGLVTFSSKGSNLHAWCVRGGQSFDGNTHTTLH